MRRYKKLEAGLYDQLNMEIIFAAFSEDEHCFFLDSSMEDRNLGRYSFIGSEPSEIIEFLEGMEKPFEILRKVLGENNLSLKNNESEGDSRFPFIGGYVGYLSYDLGRYIEVLPEKALKDIEIPYYWFGKYDNIIAIDHFKKEAWLVLNGSSEKTMDEAERKLMEKIEKACHVVENGTETSTETSTETGIRTGTESGIDAETETESGSKSKIEYGQPIRSEDNLAANQGESVANVYNNSSDTVRSAAISAEVAGLHSNISKVKYMESVDEIRNYIKSGDVYQVNMTQRFAMKTERRGEEIYKELRRRNSAPFAAFLDFSNGNGKRQILSSSPERLLKYENGIAESRPIKGTLPRGKNAAEDEKLAEMLENSEKDRSELLMIVDLVRNDIGKVAKPGTVKVPQLFHVEHYATVHHLVASVTCELDEGKDQLDLLEAIFPGGSITGAPKIRAMEIIDELEPTRRNIYTGSLGYIGYDGNMDFNILIRTILKMDDQVFYQVGGGIVWDSDPSAEFDETLHKGKAILKTLTGL